MLCILRKSFSHNKMHIVCLFFCRDGFMDQVIPQAVVSEIHKIVVHHRGSCGHRPQGVFLRLEECGVLSGSAPIGFTRPMQERQYLPPRNSIDSIFNPRAFGVQCNGQFIPSCAHICGRRQHFLDTLLHSATKFLAMAVALAVSNISMSRKVGERTTAEIFRNERTASKETSLDKTESSCSALPRKLYILQLPHAPDGHGYDAWNVVRLGCPRPST
ncbi:hypothetical protein C8F04DRAFT_1080655 [Mycena alexandri]|uniref:Uncharacterized protein n=1 Tax=Mycena alexandri TaxID=1745969 RepID=A0AAD6T8U1_9AGAR|nr:hypothetical protein C8F04DRAFT_1080655 [Mycena alexandri]